MTILSLWYSRPRNDLICWLGCDCLGSISHWFTILMWYFHTFQYNKIIFHIITFTKCLFNQFYHNRHTWIRWSRHIRTPLSSISSPIKWRFTLQPPPPFAHRQQTIPRPAPGAHKSLAATSPPKPPTPPPPSVPPISLKLPSVAAEQQKINEDSSRMSMRDVDRTWKCDIIRLSSGRECETSTATFILWTDVRFIDVKNAAYSQSMTHIFLKVITTKWIQWWVIQMMMRNEKCTNVVCSIGFAIPYSISGKVFHTNSSEKELYNNRIKYKSIRNNYFCFFTTYLRTMDVSTRLGILQRTSVSKMRDKQRLFNFVRAKV